MYHGSFMKVHVMYIPGLGDKRTFLVQKLFVRAWRAYGVRGHYFTVGWAENTPIAPKLERLINKIDALAEKGDKVALIGASAGASLALNAFVRRPDKVVGVVCISGKIHNPQNIAAEVYEVNPGFKESLDLLDSSLKKLAPVLRKRIRSVYSTGDILIPAHDSILSGAENVSVDKLGHTAHIVMQITKGARINIRFLKKLTL